MATYTLRLRDDANSRVITLKCRWLSGCRELAIAHALPGRVSNENGTVGFFRPDGSFRVADWR